MSNKMSDRNVTPKLINNGMNSNKVNYEIDFFNYYREKNF